MNRILAVLSLLLTAPPAFAGDFALTIENRSSQDVIRFNSFSTDGNGNAVEDNVGALLEHLPAGATTKLKLSITRCQPVVVYLSLEDETELTTTIDTCKDSVLTVRD